ncbi:prenyltransferase/squalene oxidase repeat-containing protein [Verrucomicrobiota bacterium]
MTSEQLDTALRSVRKYLLSSRNRRGFWGGRLSSSALANAVASFALATIDGRKHRGIIERALRWLIAHVNSDGGWGDTVGSPSNISATILCWSALTALDSERTPRGRAVLSEAENWLRAAAGSLSPDDLIRQVKGRYGSDDTFSVPILAMCAMAGRLGPDGFSRIPQLPFELATAPPALYRWINFSVVSYAMPALLAMGRLVHVYRPTINPVLGLLRDCLTPRALRMVRRMQPSHGGFQDSAVLTAFVVMGLVGAGHVDHEVVRKGEEFLVSHVREDGSWPIDTNLSIWLSSLAVRALVPRSDTIVAETPAAGVLKHWFLAQQHGGVHPMTNSPPGGWGWTDEPGSIPDGDDTASVLIALPRLGPIDAKTREAGTRGLVWLMDLQNVDGGIPAFCRGWGRLRFDRSCPTMTAAFLQAADSWRPFVPAETLGRLDRATISGLLFLHRVQAEDGSWLSLWFGNQHGPDQRNPVYGTARTVMALRELRYRASKGVHKMVERGCDFLEKEQNPDGGWCGYAGIRGSVEETALSVSALAGTGRQAAVLSGVEWLIARTGAGVSADTELTFNPAPIGLYFDRLWYHEEFYPVIFTAQALRRARELERMPSETRVYRKHGSVSRAAGREPISAASGTDA